VTLDRATKVRWAILLLILIATLVAIAYPTEVDTELVEVVVPEGRTASVLSATLKASQSAEPSWVASDDDPFASRGWESSPAIVAEPVKATVPIAAPPVDNTPPPPPPLPYKFVGQMNNGGDLVIYLGRGDQVLLAHEGDLLDGTYKVVSIRPNQIEFELVASSLRQTLPIPVQEN